MEQTANLKLPYIMPSQAQKHVTHNEAIRLLDGLVQLAVRDRDLSAPPVSPEEGECHIVAAAATGAWTGWEGQVAYFADGAWMRFAPAAGPGSSTRRVLPPLMAWAGRPSTDFRRARRRSRMQRCSGLERPPMRPTRFLQSWTRRSGRPATLPKGERAAYSTR
ncbi:DUF2793 domain-containing protein [Nitratireductor aquimarinus]|uniref:DUF2793 domain-containing protein n=1 Tax=Nitratireductor aquimarinus TaxID=889300 RepID=A0ABU4AN30_9HYPH|nr:DUF2793 domain-containing protein [Nitratireductor aquimarinus]MDV6227658.1 DUF2793 domain-containing protein [Nitratireductor aquimarinus]